MHAAAPTSSGPKGRVSTSRRRSAKRRSAGCRAVACIRFGAAHAPSPDVRFGHPGLRSLDADCAPASCLRWSATPALGAWAAPHGCFRVPCKPDAPSHTSPTRPPIQARRALPYKPDAPSHTSPTRERGLRGRWGADSLACAAGLDGGGIGRMPWLHRHHAAGQDARPAPATGGRQAKIGRMPMFRV